RRRHTRSKRDWSSDVCSSDLLTVRENLEFYAGVYGLDARSVRQQVDKWLDRSGLTDRQHEVTAAMSVGFRQRLALGCAVLHRPRSEERRVGKEWRAGWGVCQS